MELVYGQPRAQHLRRDWPIWTYQAQTPPAKFVLDEDGRRGIAINSLVSGGCIISGARCASRCCSPACASKSVRVVERSVILPDVRIGPDCQIRNAIIDASCEIAAAHVSVSIAARTRRSFLVTEKGVVLVTPDMLSHGHP